MPISSKILLVDDDIYLARSLKKILIQSGFYVVVTHTAAEALKATENERFDLCISDLALPDVVGLNFLEQLRNAKSTQNLPLIIYSGFASREREKIRKYRPLWVLNKPEPTENLLNLVREVLGETPAKPRF